MCLVIGKDRGIIVGATFIGPGTGEMLHAATIAIVGKISLDTLGYAITAFPTISDLASLVGVLWVINLATFGAS